VGRAFYNADHAKRIAQRSLVALQSGMNETARDLPKAQTQAAWGSDAIAELLRVLEIPYIPLTPGASYRGLHDSLVNYLGNTRPELLLCIHEESAVALAHGWARVTGKPLAVGLHTNVGLMHATMAIFNAWCDRIPMLLIGAVGPIDATKRRPWVDWIHTSRDLGALVRGYTKWDDQPGSIAAALEAIVRGWRLAQTPPRAPVYVCLDAALQEEGPSAQPPLPDLARFPAPVTGAPPADAVKQAAAILESAKRPLLMIGRMSSDPADFERRVALAERIGAIALTDIKTGASFPTQHALHPFPPSLYVAGPATQAVREADAILSLDWIDLAGSLVQACGGEAPRAKIVHCSLDPYLHRGWNADYQGLPPTELTILADPDALVAALLDTLGPRKGAPAKPWLAKKPEVAPAPAEPRATDRMSLEEMARTVIETLVPHKPSYIRLPLGWPGEYCRFAHPQDYIGFDGGGGIGSGPGMTVGAALALRDAKSDRLPVAVLGDGDTLMGITALWTGVHYRVPALIVVANNESFFNDELHQERMARLRGRPVENRWIGMRMSDPPLDLAEMARGQGAVGHGPLTSVAELKSALERAVAEVRSGKLSLVDARVAPEYARAVSSSLFRHAPGKAGE
jgi:thiamine pyrophosphate-dependent acetolactate synthase large subunit-like protein